LFFPIWIPNLVSNTPIVDLTWMQIKYKLFRCFLFSIGLLVWCSPGN